MSGIGGNQAKTSKIRGPRRRARARIMNRAETVSQNLTIEAVLGYVFGHGRSCWLVCRVVRGVRATEESLDQRRMELGQPVFMRGLVVQRGARSRGARRRAALPAQRM